MSGYLLLFYIQTYTVSVINQKKVIKNLGGRKAFCQYAESTQEVCSVCPVRVSVVSDLLECCYFST